MKFAKRGLLFAIKPQLILLFVATAASSGWLIVASYNPPVAAANASVTVPTAANTNDLPPETDLQLALKPLTFSVDCSMKPCLALTFDDGPDAKTTVQIVEALEKTEAKATFFVIGSRIAGHEALLQRMHADGFEIDNHSWSHADFTRLSPEQIHDQIESTQNALRSADVPAAQFFRAPYGHLNATVQKNVSLPIVLWNIDPKDWHQSDPAKLIEAVEAAARPGGIVVMHDTETITAAVMPDLLAHLEEHYQLVTVSDLLSLPPDARGETVIY